MSASSLPAGNPTAEDPVAQTARWTAAARAAERLRADRLSDDPYAEALAGPRGAELLERYGGGGVLPYLAIRTRFYDDAITRLAADHELRQVVMLAAGLDTRAYRLPWPAGTVVYELDRPALLRYKDAELAAARPQCTRRTVAVDLVDDWRTPLREAGFDSARPTLWIAEGLLFFLPGEAVEALLRTVAELSTPGSRLVTDLTSAATLTNPLTSEFRDRLAASGAPWQFGTDEPEELLRRCGWTVELLVEPGQPGASFGRWPYAVVPRSVTDIPRNFLAVASRAG